MKYIEKLDELLGLYGQPSGASLQKVSHILTPLYAKWIAASKFCVLTTTGPEGTDGSPRGDVGPVVRVNGQAKLTTDTQLRAGFERKGIRPETVIVVKIAEVYIQCSRALLRSGLWASSETQDLPTIGEIIAEASDGEAGGQEFDRSWPERAVKTLW